MAIEHSTITGADSHEPKDVGTAIYGQAYVADGVGSGSWAQPVWKDIIGVVTAQGSGAGWPSFDVFIGTDIEWFSFAAGDEAHFVFHVPHDYALGTDLYIHSHWSHNGTAISGNMTWEYKITHAKGHNQAIFGTPVTTSTTYNTVNIATTPRYRHMIDEVQISSSTPTASQIDTDDIEPDSLILVHISPTAIPTITGGVARPFLFSVDLHYQADIEGTKNKAPNFYS